MFESNWIHTGLCTLLENAFTILAVGLGICLTLHIEYDELMRK